ncbi:MAG: 2-hydroxy-3-oxopropionate reductase [Clostridia bacterium]|nr:2-hydroxy-3-oxopropionate reductase [Clostridia bacterium]
MVIGFIGLGIMGRPMAEKLCKAGYSLIVNDHHEENIARLVAAGAKEGSLKEIGLNSDVVITMLPNSPQVREVMLGKEGVASYMRQGTAFIDMSSINPVDSKYIGSVLKEKKIDMLDAPVSGGEPKAIDGTVAFMVGGDEAVFNKYKPILLHMGSTVTRCGELGAGNTTKLANQIIVACNIEALAEALTLAQKAGVDPGCVFEAIKGGLAGSTVMNAKAPMMISGDDKPGFKIDLHIKDLNNALECAHTVGAPVPMTAQVLEVMQYLNNNGDGKSDHSAIAHYYEKLADIKIGREK